MAAPRAGAVALTPLAGARQVVADYVALTKPRVQSLLLFTTVTTMLVAGTPSLELDPADLPGRLPVGRRRRRRQPLPTTATSTRAWRAPPTARCPPGACRPRAATDLRLRARRAVAASSCRCGSTRWPPRCRSAGSSATRSSTPCWLKRRTPQNIVIGGAAGRDPAARGLGRGDRRPGRHGGVPLRDRLLLDAAALLGAVAAHEGRVRARRRADAAGRARRGRDAPPDPALHASCSTRSPSCRSAPAAWGRSTSSPRSSSASCSSAAPWLLSRRADRRSALRLYLFSLAYLALLFGAMVADVKL